MTRKILALLALAVALPFAGCQALPTDAPGAVGIQSFDTGPTGDGLTVHVGPNTVVLYAKTADPSPVIVDYVIQVLKTNEIVYHVESTHALAHFRTELQRTRLPKGVYHVKVFLNKATTPIDEKDIEMS